MGLDPPANPRKLHTTAASCQPNPSSQTVPHSPPLNISTLPLYGVVPPTRRIVLAVGALDGCAVGYGVGNLVGYGVGKYVEIRVGYLVGYCVGAGTAPGLQSIQSGPLK